MALNNGTENVLADTELSEVNPSTNYGASQTVEFGTTAGLPSAKRHQVIMEFDVSGVVPAGGTLVSADLRLWVNTAGSSGRVTRWYRMTQPSWVEAQATWNNYNAAQPWATPGGDYDAAMYIESLMPIATGYDTITGFKALVLDAINNRAGVLLLLGLLYDTSLAQTCVYASREDVTPNRRPILEYTYQTVAPKGVTFKDRLLAKAAGAAQAYSFSGLRRAFRQPLGFNVVGGG